MKAFECQLEEHEKNSLKKPYNVESYDSLEEDVQLATDRVKTQQIKVYKKKDKR